MKNISKGSFSDSVIMGIRKRDDYINTAQFDLVNGFEFFAD
jgi:hypothetical protein